MWLFLLQFASVFQIKVQSIIMSHKQILYFWKADKFLFKTIYHMLISSDLSVIIWQLKQIGHYFCSWLYIANLSLYEVSFYGVWTLHHPLCLCLLRWGEEEESLIADAIIIKLTKDPQTALNVYSLVPWSQMGLGL